MIFLDVGVETTTTTIEQILAILETLDAETITASIDKLINYGLTMIAGFGGIISYIVLRYQKLKATFTGENFAEKTKVEKAEAILDETKDLFTDIKMAVTEVQATQGEKLVRLEEDYQVLYDNFMTIIKGGVLNSEVLLELGKNMANVSENSLFLTEEFVKELEEAEAKAGEQTSILDDKE